MLTLKELSYKVQNKTLLHPLSTTFYPNTLYTLIGPNGSGKTTLLKTLNGIYRPSRGEVLWKETPLHLRTRKEMSRIVTLIPQEHNRNFDFTVEEMVHLGTYVHGNNQIDHALESVHCLHLKSRYLSTLSQGELQRIYIARSLASDSPIFLCDEPTANLDIRHQKEIWRLLKRIAKLGKTVIVATHDLHAAKTTSDRTLILSNGNLTYQGKTPDILSPDIIQETFQVTEETFL